MPDIVFDSLHLEQGFDFRQDVQDACRWITPLMIGTQQLAADFNVRTPGTDAVPAKLQAVAVMRCFKWSGGVTDPIELKANISTANRNKVQSMLHAPLASTAVAFSLAIFVFDQAAAIFYAAMLGSGPSSGTSLSANIKKEGQNKLLLNLPSQLASETVKSPQNHEVDLTVMPAPLAQYLTYQYAVGHRLLKSWGIVNA